MHIESSVTSVSWIPSEAMSGMFRVPMDLGIGHYDEPLPDVLDDLEALRAADRFRFANELRAWIEVEDGRIVDHGQTGSGHIGSTTARLGPRSITFPAVALPDLRAEPQVGDGWVRFSQTAGGRTGAPMPRRVSRPPYVQIIAPIAWTSLALTIHADGRAQHEVLGASPFPRHWVYDHEGRLAAKSGLIDFKSWSLESFGERTPWGDYDSPAVVTQVETALERDLSATIMRAGAKPTMRKVKQGDALVEQGAPGAELYLLLDGVLRVEVDGEPLAEVGPGAVLGERAILEGGTRTATLRAVTACRVAVASADQLDRAALEELSAGHRREEGPAATEEQPAATAERPAATPEG
ncbi:MAG: cyclic nucleotide-binding domain-containing protein [Actinomycetota bacterium]|nr:cyclic nucleotide-binding domain-containing protein [Actinomycetota bacterium]